MVERLKTAIAKARAERARVTAGTGAPTPAPTEGGAYGPPPPGVWEELEEVELNPKHLERNRVISDARTNKAHVSFDVLRTRILRVFRKHGWTRLGITSPTKGCGKTFVATNLALSFARQPECRTVLMDLDLRSPSITDVLGVPVVEPMLWFLSGETQPSAFLRRVGPNLALGLNDRRVPNAAEALLAPQATQALASLGEALAPDVIIHDLPPMLVCDDVLGLLPELDCVLLVTSGGHTKPDEITECERLLADSHLLGVLLNRAEDASESKYGYDAA